ncbi:MAG: ABC transporter permease [Eubacterium sp.]|nr:ABC transporter permease [Eubacterium sp.]
MTEKRTENIRHTGRLAQIGIYFGKLLRMFVYQKDWKVLPIGAIIAALVTFVVGANMFVTQEGTLYGTFALTCVCIWNGFFNSIQVVCRERNILKREHRAGLHITSYIAAHMLYQLILCVLQTLVTVIICLLVRVKFPVEGVVTAWGLLDISITILLTTYAADMMALMISCIVKNTTAAMTVMPFMLIFQLVFSGGMIQLEGPAESIKVATIAHWGMDSMCTVGRFNTLPMVSLWNTLVQFKNIEVFGYKPLLAILKDVEAKNMVKDFTLWSGTFTGQKAYESVASNVLQYWGFLILLLVIFVVVGVIALKFVDKDKRGDN